MPPLSFIVFEISVYVLAVLYLRRATLHSRRVVVTLLAGMLYGVLLEYATILSYQAYTYGRFLVMIFGTVPLCIGVSWGIIIYTAMETSDRLQLPWFIRPLLDALLALTIDLSMDAIAIRLGFWTWGADGAWFGVPLGNFYGWFGVVVSFAFLLRLGHWWCTAIPGGWLRDLAVPLLAVPLSIVVLLQLLTLYSFLISHGVSAWLIIGSILAASVVVPLGFARRARCDNPLDGGVIAGPLFFHVFFSGALVWAEIYREVPMLAVVSLGMFVLGILLHLWPSWKWLRADGREHATQQVSETVR
ncbi:MAG: carotenoid biosynthesis protein [Chloroflexota bacterium]|nr:carotenoid biosynthesis protein [Chloroflexota bacterium]